jgi:DNA helicase-2/ATP-dependent DNA helicase PcrA
VTSAHLAKGLEFDQVIVSFVSSAVYQTELDRSLLYIACTRAMHKLDLTYFGELTALIIEWGKI